MKALVLTPGSPAIRLIDVPEPDIDSSDGVKVRIHRVDYSVGIAG